MPSLSTQPNRAYPSIPTVDDSIESHTFALQAIKDAMQTHERRDNNFPKSFIRFEELVDLGIIDSTGESLLSIPAAGGGNGGGGVGALDLNDLGDVEVPNPADDDLLQFNIATGEWENKQQITLAHQHTWSDITSGVPPFLLDITGEELNDLSDVTIDVGLQDAEFIVYDLAIEQWVNKTASEAGLFSVPFGAIDGDLLYYDFFSDTWLPTLGAIKWDDANEFLQLANAHAVNWLDKDVVSRELLNFESEGGVAAPQRVLLESLDAVNTGSTSYVNRAGTNIPGSNFTVDDEYLIFVDAVGVCNTSIVTGNRIRVTLDGSVMAGAEMEWEGGGASSTNGFPFEFMSTFVYAAGDIQMQHHNNPSAIGSINTNEVRMLCVNLTEIGATNFETSISTSTIEMISASYKDTGASITIGNGSDDWVIFFCVQFDNSSGATTSYNWAIDDGTTQIQWFETEIENTTDIYNRVGMFVHQGGASTTYKVVGRVNAGTGDVIFASLVAIRLNAFAQHEINIVGNPPDPSDAGEYSLASDSFTSTAPTSDWAFFGRIVELWELAGFSGGTKVSTNIAGAGLLDTAWDTDVRQINNDNVNDNQSKVQFPTTVKNVPNGDSVVVDHRHLAAPSLNDNRLTESLLVSFSWNLVAGGDDVFAVGNPLYRTDIHGLTVRIPSDSAPDTDYIEITPDETTPIVDFVGSSSVDFTGPLSAEGFTFSQGVRIDGNLILDETIPTILFKIGGTERAAITALATRLTIDVGSQTSGNLLDITDGLISMVSIDATNGLRIFGAGQETDYQQTAHDDTDFNTSYVNTTDANWTGVTGQYTFDNELNITGDIIVSGLVDGKDIAAHHDDATIHFTEASIDHTAILNIGTNSHAAIDTHIADGAIHFTEASIDHAAILNIGTNSHAAIDTHLALVNEHIDWSAAAAGTIHTDNYIENATHTGQVTGAVALALDITAITDQPAAGVLVGADTFIVNDGGVLSEISATDMNVFFGGGGADLAADEDITGDWIFSGLSFSSADAAGPQMLDEAATATNPTLIPNKADPDTGVGWSAGNDGALIAGGTTIAIFALNAQPQLILTDSPGAAGAPTLAFGDGDTGFLETADDVLALSISSALRWSWSSDEFKSTVAGAASIKASISGSTIPTLNPRDDDLNTGIGGDGSDTLYLISGGFARVTITSTLTQIDSSLLTAIRLGVGTGSVSDPAINFGDDDTGFFEPSDDNLRITLGGVAKWSWQADRFEAVLAGGPAMLNENAASNNPVFCPDKDDLDTGIGYASTDALSIICGAIEAIRYTESSNDILQAWHINRALIAAAGGGQGAGTPVRSSINIYATVANTGDSATLPAIFISGTWVWIKNNGANQMDIFPASGDDLGAGTNIAVTLDAGVGTLFLADSGNQVWTQMF